MGQNNQNHGNILVVDDTSENLRLLTRQLGEAGYRVRPAPSGFHALSTAKKEVPDLILLDIMMPEMDGYEVCRRLKANEMTAQVPVIFLSALDEVEDKMRGFEVGGVDYITKPFQEKEVLARVETHLKIRFLQRQLQDENLRFKTLSEATFEGILLHDQERIIDLNRAAASMLGAELSELVGYGIEQFFPDDFRERIANGFEEPWEGELVRMEGSLLPVEVRSRPFPSDNSQVMVTAVRDLSLQKKMEQEKEDLLQENSVLKTSINERFRFGEIIGRSPAMQKVYELISRAAASTYPVVISGESGTGKELVAKTIHERQSEKQGAFVAVNCGAVTETLFEREFFGHRKGAFTDAVRDEPGFLAAAHGGTLFLDEIGDLPLVMQVKLLRFLESGEFIPVGDVVTKKVEVRVICASNKDLSGLVRKGEFREDLFYRLHVIEIGLPPLRERREDIRLLVESILERHNAGERMLELPSSLREMFFHYEWPGNVRELMNTIQRFLATDSVSLPGNRRVPSSLENSLDQGLHGAVEQVEKKMIVEALEKTGWHRGNTAELLGIPRRTLLRKMNKYQFEGDD